MACGMAASATVRFRLLREIDGLGRFAWISIGIRLLAGLLFLCLAIRFHL
jgi:hypothetical protein